VIWGQGSDRLVDEIRDFVTGTLPKARGEAIDAAASGRNGSGGHADLVQNEFLLAGGVEIRRSPGSAFAVFQRPTRSIECAMAIGKRLKPFDLKARAAIHVGECEVRGDDFSGVAVDVSSRLLDHARPGQIVVSRTVRDLVVGSGLQFKEIGELRANGLPGALQFFSVTQKIAQ
jgi:class 3 adenylate cyclase